MERKNKFKENDKPKEWRKMFDFFDDNNKPIRVWKDWIAYGDLGFNPNVHKDVIKTKEYELIILKDGLEKWKKEFKN